MPIREIIVLPKETFVPISKAHLSFMESICVSELQDSNTFYGLHIIVIKLEYRLLPETAVCLYSVFCNSGHCTMQCTGVQATAPYSGLSVIYYTIV